MITSMVNYHIPSIQPFEILPIINLIEEEARKETDRNTQAQRDKKEST